MIVKRHFKNPIVHKMAEGKFKDTSNAEDLHQVYDQLDSIGVSLDDLVAVLSSLNSEESAYLLDKLRKVRKYMTGIAFRQGCFDSEGGYYGSNRCSCNTCSSDGSCSCKTPAGYDVPSAGCYPGDNCVITSE